MGSVCSKSSLYGTVPCFNCTGLNTRSGWFYGCPVCRLYGDGKGNLWKHHANKPILYVKHQGNEHPDVNKILGFVGQLCK